MSSDCDAIAIIGAAGRFPGARSVDELWTNVVGGVDSISRFSVDELRAAGVPAATLDDPHYVRAWGVLDDVAMFDAPFFQLSPRDAEAMDPQQRLFLECAHEALERAGHDGGAVRNRVGVFAGADMSTYFLSCVHPNRGALAPLTDFELMVANDKDYLATRAAYKLGLTGPAVAVQTACSTSLVAVHLACNALLEGECDMALAGGVHVRVPQVLGYQYTEGGLVSSDGRCRPFDARATGIVGGNGVAVVVLRRLEDALAGGDAIRAIIRGSAINNDGSRKVGYTAPSVQGQADVVREALATASLRAEDIGYVEAHGTATPVGDPIEVAALTDAFRATTKRVGFCALGSLKSNVGHLGAAAGVAGLIRAMLAIENAVLPPTANFESYNPRIRFEDTPFVVSPKAAPWAAPIRRAGVSSFGLGGTNAHVVLEQAPPRTHRAPEVRRPRVLVWSARSAGALETMTKQLGQTLPSVDRLADAAFTQLGGRRRHEHRRAMVCDDREGAARVLAECDLERIMSHRAGGSDKGVVFMFPGQGAQYQGMGAELYRSEPAFRRHADDCLARLAKHVSFDARERLFPSQGSPDPLTETEIAQPALFVVEYSLARTWIDWGVRPAAMVSHSFGEYVAGCLSGVIGLEDSIALVALRGKLAQSLPRGRMLTVEMSESEVAAAIRPPLNLAAVNGPLQCVVSGPIDAIEVFQQELTARGRRHHVLVISHAFHSPMMEPIVRPLAEAFAKVKLSAPKVPYMTSKGRLATIEDATNPLYWASLLCSTVRFRESLDELLNDESRVFLEVGPGRTLSGLVRQRDAKRLAFSSMRHPHESIADAWVLAEAAARLWLTGQTLDPAKMFASDDPRRLELPTYPFERRRYFLEPVRTEAASSSMVAGRNLESTPSEPNMRPPTARGPGAAHPRPDLLNDYVAARTPVEEGVCSMFVELLGASPVGIHDSFFELGGDSLRAVQLAARINQRFQLAMPVAEIFTSPTPAKLTRTIDQMLTAKLDALSDDEVARLLNEQPVADVPRSRGRRIVLTAFGSLGDLFPFLVIAKALKARGHDVTLAATNVYASIVEAHGIAFAPIGPDFRERIDAARSTDPDHGMRYLVTEVIMPVIGDLYRDLAGVATNADLLVTQSTAFAGPVVAEKLRIPWVSAALAPSWYVSAHDICVRPPVLPGLVNDESTDVAGNQRRIDRARAEVRSWSEPLRALRRELGLPAGHDPLFEGQHSPLLSLATFSDELARARPDWPSSARATGFLFSEDVMGAGLRPEIEQFLANGAPPVIFSLGSAIGERVTAFFAASAEAAARLGVRAILLTHRADGAPRDLPRDVAAFPYAPHASLFPRARAVVHQGGIGVSAETLRAAVPMLVVPHAFDQHDNAARLERLGVATTLHPSQYTAESAASALRALLDDPARDERSRVVARTIRREDGVARACDEIERVLGVASQPEPGSP